MRKLGLLFPVLLLCILTATGQNRTVTGKVVDENGLPVAGASVQIKGGKKGVSADAEGNFKINAATGDVLLISAINFTPREIAADSDNLPVTLKKSERMIDEVVVTALGISRQKKALGYAIQEVKGSELTQSNESNVLNSLSGKVAGAQITSASGAVGAGSRIVLRGNNSFGDNQPLFVVDGVPISNNATSVGASGSVDYGSGINDIDPNNIASISVLKGANAAALYGSRAANGVILITTKNGKTGNKGIGVSYTGGFSFEKQYILPRYQNQYGQGWYGDEYYWKQYQQGNLNLEDIGVDPSLHPQNYQEWAQQIGFAYKDGLGNGVNDGVDESWGPRLNNGLKLPQYNSPVDANGNRLATPWIAHPNNVRDFFQTGYSIDNAVALTSNTDKGNTRLSLSQQKQVGTIPNTDQKRYTVQLNTSQNLTDKLHADAMINYVRTDNNNLIGQGYNEYNPMEALSWFGRQVDMSDLKANYNKEFANGLPYNWNSNYHDNPYFTVYKNLNSRNKDRVFGYFSLSYKFDKWANLMVRVGDDWSNEFRKELTANKSNSTLVSAANGLWGGGKFRQYQYALNELNADLIVTGSGKLGRDFSLNYTAGGNYRDNKQRNSTLGADKLTVPDLFTISNAKGQPVTGMYSSHLRTNSIYGQASLGYKNWLYLDATARNDWSSTLPQRNWSFFYPSVSLSWIFTDALNISSSVLNYGKLRTSWAKVGSGGTTPYQLIADYIANTASFNGVTLYSLASTLPAANLKPEANKSTEIGLDLQFLKGRIALDATYYNKITNNQIMAVNISNATGFSKLNLNAGEIQNKGVEIQLNAGILRSDKGLNWDITVNWAKNKNTVNKLYTDPVTHQELTSFNITSAWSTTVDAIPGKAYGVIRGTAFARDANGAVIVGDDGLPTFTSTPKELGNITPDWTGGVSNNFSYRNFRLGFLVDVRKGGDVFSVTDWFGSYTGILKYTAENGIRENGVVVGKDVLQNEKVVTADGKPNDVRVGAMDYYHSLYGGRETSIIDGSFIKLRQIELGYTFPARFINRVGWLKGLGVSVFAHNVALLYTDKSNKAHIDPETAFGVDNAGLGIEQYQIPSNRSIGIKLNANF